MRGVRLNKLVRLGFFDNLRLAAEEDSIYAITLRCEK